MPIMSHLSTIMLTNYFLLPKENMKDLEEIPSNVLEKLNVIPISSAMEALSYVLPGKKG